MTWNLVDLFLLLLVLLNVWQGWRRGFIFALFDLARWAGSLLLALRFYQPLARLLGMQADWPGAWDRPIAFVLTLVTASIAIYFLEVQILRRLPREYHQHRTNRFFGILPGVASGLILAAMVAPLLLALPLPERLSTPARESTLANRLAIVSDWLEASLSPLLEDTRRTLNLRTIPPESSERLTLPFAVVNPKPRPDLEARMLELVNQERTAAGLAPLAADPELTAVARQHSADMFARSYFSHHTLEGETPFDRMREAKVRFLTAGENLALAPTLQLAHNGLMQSPGHRANILRLAFGRLGIGILDGGRHGLMVTQNFRN